MTVAALSALCSLAVAMALLVSTVLVQVGVRPRRAIVCAAVATPLILALPFVVLVIGLVTGAVGTGAP